MLASQGVKEVTLLGQNVNSYADFSVAPGGDPAEAMRAAARAARERSKRARELAERGAEAGAEGPSASPASASSAALAADPRFASDYAPGFRSVYVPARDGSLGFADLLRACARAAPEVRIRFTSPHPKDFDDDVLAAIAAHPNVCKQLHMPAQSGSTSCLERMRRGYSREAYDALVARVRRALPSAALSTDVIAGFCGETEDEHAATLDLMRTHAFEQAFMFAYSTREGTYASKKLEDDVPEATKQRRLAEIIEAYRRGLDARSRAEAGRTHLVLVEGEARKGAGAFLTGRTDTFRRVVFDNRPVPNGWRPETARDGQGAAPLRPGDYVAVTIEETGGTLRGRPLYRTTLQGFARAHGGSCLAEPGRGAHELGQTVQGAEERDEDEEEEEGEEAEVDAQRRDAS